jgi:hypothetical protein
VVPAGEHEHVQQLRLGEHRRQLVPQRLGDGRRVAQLVDEADDHPVPWLGPARVVRAAEGQRAQVVRGQAGPFGEDGRVHAKLILAPAAGRDPVDDDLPKVHVERQAAAQAVPAPSLHRRGHRGVLGQGAEQRDRALPGRCHRPQQRADLLIERLVQRNDTHRISRGCFGYRSVLYWF